MNDGTKDVIMSAVMNNEEVLFQWCLFGAGLDDDEGKKLLGIIVKPSQPDCKLMCRTLNNKKGKGFEFYFECFSRCHHQFLIIFLHLFTYI